MESGPEETPRAPKGQKKPKPESNTAKKAKVDQASACTVAEATDVKGKESRKGEAGNEIEVFPPKMVAMHRVRWNMNKGSERWLCSGGAAGIVRCQEIRIPDIRKKYTRKGRNWNWKINMVRLTDPGLYKNGVLGLKKKGLCLVDILVRF